MRYLSPPCAKGGADAIGGGIVPLLLSLPSEGVCFATSRGGGLCAAKLGGVSAHSADLLILQNDRMTIPQSPLRGASSLYTREPFWWGGLGTSPCWGVERVREPCMEFAQTKSPHEA